MRALEENRLPSSLQPDNIRAMYAFSETLNFSAFTGYLYAKKVFERFALTSPTQYITIDEWNNWLTDDGFNANILKLIDDLYMPTVEEVAEAAARKKSSLLETDFLVTFL